MEIINKLVIQDVYYGGNDEVSKDDLLKGIIIASGNDACIALAKGIAGTEEEFAILMTAKAQELGMKILILQIHLE